MINHLRTLLLNETQGSLQRAGFPYGSPWLVSSKFNGVEIPKSLVPVHDGIFSGTKTLQDRVARVDAMVSILAAKDMQRYVNLFDRRMSVPLARQSESVFDLYAVKSLASEEFEHAVLDGARAAGGLYTAVGNYDFDNVLPELKLLAVGAFEWPLRVSAVVLAYCIQLDKLNGALNG